MLHSLLIAITQKLQHLESENVSKKVTITQNIKDGIFQSSIVTVSSVYTKL